MMKPIILTVKWFLHYQNFCVHFYQLLQRGDSANFYFKNMHTCWKTDLQTQSYFEWFQVSSWEASLLINITSIFCFAIQMNHRFRAHHDVCVFSSFDLYYTCTCIYECMCIMYLISLIFSEFKFRKRFFSFNLYQCYM